MKELHVLFCGIDNIDTTFIQKTISTFPGGIRLLVCSQSDRISDELESRIGVVYSFEKPFIIHTSTVKADSTSLSNRIHEFISLGYDIKFNITSSGPFESYVAFMIGQHYPNIEIYAMDDDEKIRILNLDRVASLDSLKEDQKLLILALGEEPSGRTYNDLVDSSIITSKGTLKKRGLTRLLKTMNGKYITFVPMEKKHSAGKRPYIWKLNDAGQRLFEENINNLIITRNEAIHNYSKVSHSEN